MQKLKFYDHSNVQCTHQVSVHYEVKNALEVTFLVESKSEWNTNKSFGSNPNQNWGLWEHDVVECFFHQKGHPYYEVQLSPLSQGFNLVVLKARETFYTPLDYHPQFHCEFDEKSWKAKMHLPLEEFAKDELYANFFACLGKESSREYFALNVNNTNEKPDFHRPELFIKL